MFVILRSLMVLFCTVLGGVLAAVIYHLPGGTFLTRMPLPAAIVTGIIGGILLAAAAILIEHFVRRLSLVELAVVMAGLLIGTGIAFLVAHFQMLLPDFIQQALRPYNPYISVLKLALYVVFVYVGIVVGVRGK